MYMLFLIKMQYISFVIKCDSIFPLAYMVNCTLSNRFDWEKSESQSGGKRRNKIV